MLFLSIFSKVLHSLAQYKVGVRKSMFQLMETAVGYDTFRNRVRETSKTYKDDILQWIKKWYVLFWLLFFYFTLTISCSDQSMSKMNGFGLLFDNLDRVLLSSGDANPYSCTFVLSDSTIALF